MKNAKIILMDLPCNCRFGRQVCRGVYRYARPNRQWAFITTIAPEDINRYLKFPDMVGMISMRRPEEYTTVARRYGLAAVGVGRWTPKPDSPPMPYVDVDPKAIGEMAANYFVDRGFRNFGMFDADDAFHCPFRGEAFAAALRRRKLPCDIFDSKKKYPPCGKPLPSVTKASERMRRWMAGLAKPLAVFCIDDYTALWVCEICRRAGIHVPEEVAIIGADDDDLLCGISWPHLSSIAVPAEQVGYESARLLDAMLSGKKPPKRPVLLPPIRVVTRQSTDVMAIEDLRVVEAVRFIREHAHEGIRVKHVMEAATLPKRMLERQFRKILGRGPFAEIRRVQIERIRMFLAQTDMTLEAIAPECGFQNISHMSAAFKKITGTTPGAYRKQFRSR